jgi:hypothetical protein
MMTQRDRCIEQAERIMATRTRRETVYFKHPFKMQGIDRLLSAGPYEILTDEELIEGLSFPCYRRVSTMIMVPAAASCTAAIEMVSISSVDLSNAQLRDARAACDPS